MKVFKAVICLVLTTLICFFPVSVYAFAEGGETAVPVKKYAYADIDSNAYFCEEPNENTARFLIPETYCVEILGEEKNWYKIKYAEDVGIYRAVEGYCLKDDVVLCDEPLENLYLHLPVTVVYRTDSVSSLLPPLGDIEITVAFYGSYKIGKTSCSYVYNGEKFAYIPGVIENYPLNTLPERPTLAPADSGGGNAALIAAIVVSAVAAVAITVLYFTGKRAPKTDTPQQ